MKLFRIFTNIRLGARINYVDDEFSHEDAAPAVSVRTDCRWFCGVGDMSAACPCALI